jgi:uncharacterized protein YqjF (DUF2071 family)
MAELVTPEAPILPWPRILRQSWLNLSFLHWAVEPASIAHLYPPETQPDTFEGAGFVGVVPFQMADTGFARGPAFFGTFLETNVRLYSVDRTGRRGVLFCPWTPTGSTWSRRAGGSSACPIGGPEWVTGSRGTVAPTPRRCAGGESVHRASSR